MKFIYNEKTQRYNDFHCGESFKIKIYNEWKIARIEFGKNGWYLICEDNRKISCKELEGADIKVL